MFHVKQNRNMEMFVYKISIKTESGLVPVAENVTMPHAMAACIIAKECAKYHHQPVQLTRNGFEDSIWIDREGAFVPEPEPVAGYTLYVDPDLLLAKIDQGRNA